MAFSGGKKKFICILPIVIDSNKQWKSYFTYIFIKNILKQKWTIEETCSVLCVCVYVSSSVVSYSLQPQGL